jgi:exosortase/archaeosortase family protein
MKKPNLYHIFVRYVILLLLGLGNVALFYFIFSSLTIQPVNFILSLFYDVNLTGIELTIDNKTIRIIEACIAGAAYYLLTILNLATPMKLKKRFYSLVFSFILLLILNITRIVALSVMFVNNAESFDFTHKLLWYGLSTIFVVGIWFLTVYLFKIKEIPFYTDYKEFIKVIRK